jgi:cytochrome c-type biogenesis protein
MSMPDLALVFNEISAVSPLAFALVALVGLVMGVAPNSLPMYSIVIGYVVGGRGNDAAVERGRGFFLAFGFVLGMATVDAAIGALFGLIGDVLIRALASYLVLTNLFLAVFLVIFGLALLRKIRIGLPVLRPGLKRANSFPAAYLLGIPFGLSTCPSCTPMILPILGAAAATGGPWLGAALLFVFGLARGAPLVLAGAAAGMVDHVQWAATWVPIVERTGGVLMLVASLYFVYESAAYAGLVTPFRYLFG